MRPVLWIRGALAASLVVFHLASNSFAGQPSGEGGRLTVATNRFAADLHHTLTATGNLVYSPESIFTALSMTAAGADGTTLDEILKALHWEGKASGLAEAEEARLAVLSTEDRGYRLRLANSFWGQTGEAFLASFTESLRKQYGAAVETADFRKKPEAARGAVNAWVARATEDKIPELLPAGVVGPATRLVLVNAIYFKAPWMHPFKKELSRDLPFDLDGKRSAKVPTMSQTERLAYGESDEIQLVELPYKGRALSFVVLLPRGQGGLAGIEKQLARPGGWEAWMEMLKPRRVELTLPRFRFASSFRLKASLAELGVRKAFESRAEFSRMSRDSGISLADVLHQSLIGVDENGTEAAAATATVMFGGALTGSPAVMRVDHPFLFAIRDSRTGGLLFVGRVTDPTAG